MVEQDHAVSVSACDGCVLPSGTQGCLTRGPESVERRVHSPKSVVVVLTDGWGCWGIWERSAIIVTHGAGSGTGQHSKQPDRGQRTYQLRRSCNRVREVKYEVSSDSEHTHGKPASGLPDSCTQTHVRHWTRSLIQLDPTMRGDGTWAKYNRMVSLGSSQLLGALDLEGMIYW
jgi:hypothetical protein